MPDTALRYVPGGAVAATREGGGRSSEIASEEAEGGPIRVWTLRNGRPEPVMVTVGLEGDTYAELQNAPLKAGDPVIVSEKGPAAAAPSRPRMFRF